jgi:hypothetical protein
MLDIGTYTARIAAATFNTKSKVLFLLDEYNTHKKVLTALNNKVDESVSNP